MKHTKGPWHVRAGVLWGNAEETVAIGELYCWSDDTVEARGEAVANASLIAAAPELLSALQVAALVIRFHVPDLEDCGGYQAVVASIAKATKEQS